MIRGYAWIVAFLIALSPVVLAQEYDRSEWLPRWSSGDVSGDRLDTRQEVLAERSVVPVTIECGARRCRVSSGLWVDDYTGQEIVADTADEVALMATIEHVIPLAEAHRAGGACWPRDRKRDFANNKAYLLVISRSSNASRGDDDGFIPWYRPCRFVEIYIRGKAQNGLNYDLPEAVFFAEKARGCGLGILPEVVR